VLAARGHDRRSPPVKSQGDGRMRTGTGPGTTRWSPLITSTAWQSRFNERGEKVLSSHMDSVRPLVGQQAMMHPSRLSLNVVEDRTAFEAAGEVAP
jgi:hypothetical protein